MLAIYGAGGFALQILDIIEREAALGERVCFFDDNMSGEVFGIPILPREDYPDAHVAIAIANPDARRSIASSFSRFRSLVADTAIVSRHALLGEGAILAHNTIVEAGVTIGAHFHGNIYSYVAHEAVIGDFVTFAPRVSCNGRVRIGDGTYIGTGAFLKQGISIGIGATVGMGSVVLNDVPDGATVVGNPARILRTTKA